MLKKEGYMVVDLFAGPGGLGEGFSALGFDNGKSPFKLAVSIEKDPSAHSTLLLRSFYRQFTQDDTPQKYWEYVRGDITKVELFDSFPNQAKAAAEEAQCLELGKVPHGKVKKLIHQRLNGCGKWVLVGGPPCQAYSTVGKRLTDDPRGKLFQEYFRVLKEFNPSLFLFENVKGLLSMQGGELLKSIVSLFATLGYKVQYRLLNAADYGAPQIRERVVIVGSKLKVDFEYPTPTHHNPEECPGLFNNILKPYLTLEEAISDLPFIKSNDESFEYSSEPQTP